LEPSQKVKGEGFQLVGKGSWYNSQYKVEIVSPLSLAAAKGDFSLPRPPGKKAPKNKQKRKRKERRGRRNRVGRNGELGPRAHGRTNAFSYDTLKKDNGDLGAVVGRGGNCKKGFMRCFSTEITLIDSTFFHFRLLTISHTVQ